MKSFATLKNNSTQKHFKRKTHQYLKQHQTSRLRWERSISFHAILHTLNIYIKDLDLDILRSKIRDRMKDG